MRFTSATQLKDWIKNKSRQIGAPANVLLQTYMMERLLERISVSSYRDNLILKGGFLIAAMVGIDRRTTMDLDATIKNLTINRDELAGIIGEIISLDVDDDVTFEIKDIKNIRDDGEYNDYRISLLASFNTIRVNMKVDVTTGDAIIPREIDYSYKLMFEDRTIHVMAYNLYTILAEKIETILSRNVTNSRGRDFYDTYILLTMSRNTLSRNDLLHAIRTKSKERDSISAIENYAKHLGDIAKSPEIAKIWAGYTNNYHYAKGVAMPDILTLIDWVFKE